MGVKHTQAQELLKNIKLTGQTPSGDAQTLDTEVKDQPSKLNIEAEQEYILINLLNGVDIEINARFIKQDVPTDKEKFLFMLGAACYGAMFKFSEFKLEEIETEEQRGKLFENFMQELTKDFKTYRKSN
ncbi:hypothetical protein VNN38_08650 [Lactococcus petauri]|uniref:Uncharacterized protein n=1 Tax=Lactococcus petauri TaxID=1940789 RepID=A0ABZ2SJL7_9LACT